MRRFPNVKRRSCEICKPGKNRSLRTVGGLAALASFCGVRELVAAVSTEERFWKDLLGLPRDDQKKIVRALGELQKDPMHQSEPLKGKVGVFRRRADPYRILFAFSKGWVHVYSVQHRRSVYEGNIAGPRDLPTVTAPAGAPPALPPSELTLVAPAVRDLPIEEEILSAPPFAWDAVAKVITSQNAEDLYELIEFGLPGPVFDELYGRLRQIPPRQSIGSFWLVREQVLDSFYGPLLQLPDSARPLELTVVAPWITPWDAPLSSFGALVRYVRSRRVRTVLLTRPPVMPQHRYCIEQLASVDNVDVYFLDDLHAKFFVCDIAPAPFALVASANSTSRSLSNHEVGIFMRGNGEAEGIVRDLQALSVDLRVAGKRQRRPARI